MFFEFHSNFICCICWLTRRRRLSASKILQSEGSLASNWQRSLFSSPRWLTDGARLSENSVGQGCNLRRSTCMMRIIGSSNQPPKPGFVDDVTTFSNLKNLPFFFFLIDGNIMQHPRTAMRKRAAAWLRSWRFKCRDLTGLCHMLGSSLG